MRYIYFFLLLFFTSLPTISQTLTGGIQYSVDVARKETFDFSPSFNISNVKNNIYDNNYYKNKSTLLKGDTRLNDRVLAQFSDGSYGVIYNDKPLEVYYFSPSGVLTHYEEKSSTDYPYKTSKYDISGQLIVKTLRVSEDETFIFTPDKTLVAHWVGQYCYNNEGKVVMAREIYK